MVTCLWNLQTSDLGRFTYHTAVSLFDRQGRGATETQVTCLRSQSCFVAAAGIEPHTVAEQSGPWPWSWCFLMTNLGGLKTGHLLYLVSGTKCTWQPFVIYIMLRVSSAHTLLSPPSSHPDYMLVIFLLKNVCSVKKWDMDIIKALALLFPCTWGCLGSLESIWQPCGHGWMA